jgi:hypothetical protein
MRIAAPFLAAATALSLAGLAGGSSVSARLRIQPPSVVRGSSIKLIGSGFRPSLKVTLDVRRPLATKRARFGSVIAGRKGAFVLTKKISRSTGAGKWVVRACQRVCRIRTTARFYVSKIKPVRPD